MTLFHTAHYNILAAQIRDLYEQTVDTPDAERRRAIYARRTLEILAINLAKRFKVDNPIFDPLKFLDACSPNPEQYPISELWEGATT